MCVYSFTGECGCDRSDGQSFLTFCIWFWSKMCLTSVRIFVRNWFVRMSYYDKCQFTGHAAVEYNISDWSVLMRLKQLCFNVFVRGVTIDDGAAGYKWMHLIFTCFCVELLQWDWRSLSFADCWLSYCVTYSIVLFNLHSSHSTAFLWYQSNQNICNNGSNSNHYNNVWLLQNFFQCLWKCDVIIFGVNFWAFDSIFINMKNVLSVCYFVVISCTLS